MWSGALAGGHRDIAIVGDDDIESAAAAAVPLSSILRPAAVVGEPAAELPLEVAGDEDGTR